ncbi:ribosome biogenesis GTP-binding protein YihA/YsxC [Haoranjiania flava]|uniref:Probable GTP-binding protein EngB n=1 Tax=Haoranjiania flava TaxID=1856322 RepID=A0AAE3ISY4_9BACT|nr:ribosome biogenesis GTP-binding protein YihA/YsxC [Haoranjiania flava]MCU7695237.1 ribosome biogenesis GTP-binding protein YihA/YsxC [Haoranjiania flava]
MVIKNATYVISSPSYKNCPPADMPEYAFIGRSNVGKSSLINLITNRQNLAKTSATPGKTQLINHFLIESGSNKQGRLQWYLVDLPGYGYAKKAKTERKSWSKMIEDYLLHRENLVNLFVLIDSRHKPQRIDLEFLSQLYEWEMPFTLVFTKADKEKPGVVQRNVDAFLEELKASTQFLPQVIVTSSAKKSGKEELLELIARMNESSTEQQ